jgi:hypothetical protein
MFTEFRNVHRQLEGTGRIKQNNTETDFERIICDPTKLDVFSIYYTSGLLLAAFFLHVIIRNAVRIMQVWL